MVRYATGDSPITSQLTPSRSSTGITPSSTRWTAARYFSAKRARGSRSGSDAVEQLLAAGNPDAVIAQVNACKSETERRRDKTAANEAIDDLVRYYTNNAERMEYAYYRSKGNPIGTGAVESAHRHVLQTRMKRAGQRWALPCARRMARLRAAYRTGGATHFYDGIRRAHRDSHLPRLRGRKQTFRYARYGRRDLDHAEKMGAAPLSN